MSNGMSADSQSRFDIVCLPGDGVGPEVMAEAAATLSTLGELFGCEFQLHEHLMGGAAVDATGEPLPAQTLSACRQADAVLLGAVGGPKWDVLGAEQRPETGLLALRAGLGLFCNLRPVDTHPALHEFSPLRAERLKGVNLMLVRELTGGIYFGEKKREGDSAQDLCVYTRGEIERITHKACQLAASRRGKLTLVDKANVLETSRLWREVVTELVREQYPDLEYEVLLVDAAAMHLLSRPADFDVMLTENLFGDILSDEASMLCGSMGLLPSASLAEGRFGLYEPVHGSAPDIAGKSLANPHAMLLSVAMMLRHSLDMPHAADALEQAVRESWQHGELTRDLRADGLSTRQAGECVRARLMDAAAAGWQQDRAGEA
jgi:3-isopropylmalate dehydrogenase